MPTTARPGVPGVDSELWLDSTEIYGVSQILHRGGAVAKKTVERGNSHILFSRGFSRCEGTGKNAKRFLPRIRRLEIAQKGVVCLAVNLMAHLFAGAGQSSSVRRGQHRSDSLSQFRGKAFEPRAAFFLSLSVRWEVAFLTRPQRSGAFARRAGGPGKSFDPWARLRMRSFRGRVLIT